MPLALLLALPLLAAVPDVVPSCSVTPAALPAPLGGWKAGKPVAAGSNEAVFPSLPLGTRAEVTLADDARVRYVVQPEKPAAPGTKGGLLSFKVARAGTYRVALGAAAWIDLLAGVKPIASTAHDHGPACSGIRKMVDFKLAPGTYVLQISGSGVSSTGVLVTPLP